MLLLSFGILVGIVASAYYVRVKGVPAFVTNFWRK